MTVGASKRLLLNDRLRIWGTLWIVIFFAVLLALAAPWYLRIIELDLFLAGLALFLFASLFMVLAALVERASSPKLMRWMSLSLHILSVLFLVGLWALIGGLRFPLYLVLLLLPVIAAGLLPGRSDPILVAAVTLIAVLGVALLGSAEVRWYLAQLGLPVATFSWPTLGDGTPLLPEDLGPRHQLVALIFFASVVIAAALSIQAMASLLSEIGVRLGLTGQARREAESLAQQVLRGGNAAAVLVYADTGQVLEASDVFLRRNRLSRRELRGQTIFELVDFAYPEAVMDLLADGGEVPFTTCRADGETRVLRLVANSIRHGGEHFALLILEDQNELYALQAALGALAEPVMILSESDRLLYQNAAASGVFGRLEARQPVSEVLGRDELPAGWWRSAGRRREQRLDVAGISYRAHLSPARMPGGGEDLTILTLRPEQDTS